MDEILDYIHEKETIFTEEERIKIEWIAFKGIPDDKRRKFWNACTGIKAYQKGYCKDYYKKLVEADESGETKYPNPTF